MELNVRERDESGRYMKMPPDGSCVRCQSEFTEKSPRRSRGMCGTCYNKVRWFESLGNKCNICESNFSDDVVHHRMGHCKGCAEILSKRPYVKVCKECHSVMKRKTQIGLCPICKKKHSTRPKKVTAVLSDEQRSLLRILFVRYKRHMNTLVDNFRVADVYADVFIVSDSFYNETNTYKDLYQIEVMLKVLKKLYDGN
jgi:RNA polymerase subunit RPABC4/transcription elongation factor Spt4